MEKSEPDQKPTGNSQVGYKSPPESNRFEKGKSGNPYGRPKGAKNKLRPPDGDMLGELILKEAYREIKVNEGPKQITIPMIEGIIRSISVSAVKGNTKSQELFLKYFNEKEAKRKQSHDKTLFASIEYKEKAQARIELHARLGIEPPELYPHPKYIHINWEDETYVINGPISKDEANQNRAKYKEELKEKHSLYLETIAEAEEYLKTKEGQKYKKHVLQDIETQKKMLKTFEEVIAYIDSVLGTERE